MVGAATIPRLYRLSSFRLLLPQRVGCSGMTPTAQNWLWLALKVGGELAAEEVISTLCVACGAAGAAVNQPMIAAKLEGRGSSQHDLRTSFNSRYSLRHN